jgi:hypothetical protein
MCPFMLIIKGDSDSRSHKERDGRDRGIMHLSVGVQDDVHLDAPLVGAHKRPSQSRRMEEIRLHQDGVLGAADALQNCASRTAVGAEIDRSRGVPWAVASRSVRPTEPPIQPTEETQTATNQPPPGPYWHPCPSEAPRYSTSTSLSIRAFGTSRYLPLTSSTTNPHSSRTTRLRAQFAPVPVHRCTSPGLSCSARSLP